MVKGAENRSLRAVNKFGVRSSVFRVMRFKIPNSKFKIEKLASGRGKSPEVGVKAIMHTIFC